MPDVEMRLKARALMHKAINEAGGDAEQGLWVFLSRLPKSEDAPRIAALLGSEFLAQLERMALSYAEASPHMKISGDLEVLRWFLPR